jgi:Zn-finger nucleic acid-binding protein
MPKVEPRFPCPVCLGIPMDKARVGGQGELVLDYCPRCGGMWFELGEVQQLRQRKPRQLWKQIPQRPSPARTLCHSCHAPLDRAAESCPACQSRNTLDCPSCQQPLLMRIQDGLRLDVCEKCRGVWFDHAELSAIWKLSLTKVRKRRAQTAVSGRANDAAFVMLDPLIYAPDIVFLGARAAGYAVSGAVEAAANSGALDAIGDVAGSVFEVIVEIIGGVFS